MVAYPGITAARYESSTCNSIYGCKFSVLMGEGFPMGIKQLQVLWIVVFKRLHIEIYTETSNLMGVVVTRQTSQNNYYSVNVATTLAKDQSA